MKKGGSTTPVLPEPTTYYLPIEELEPSQLSAGDLSLVCVKLWSPYLSLSCHVKHTFSLS